MVIGQTLLPVWFFQGIEQMKYITYLSLAAKVVFVVLVFTLVRTADDYPYILFFNGLGTIAPGAASLWLAQRTFKLSLKLPTQAQVRQQLREGWYVFISNFSISVYINSNVFILGLFTNDVVVGYYGIAERVVGAVRQLLVVFSQAVYPHVCKLSQHTFEQIRAFFAHFFLPFALLIIVGCAGVFVFADEVVYVLAGSRLPQVSLLLRLLAFVPVIVLFNIPAYQVLLAYNLPRSYMIVLTSASCLNLLLNSVLAYFFGGTGTAISVLVTELFVTVGLYVLVEIKHARLSFFNHSHS
jgi:PST family polysaccharide transporter